MNSNRCFIFLVSTLLLSGRLIAGAGSQESREVDFFYKAYSEAEINEAIKRPLTLKDCISIALAKNIPLKLVQGDVNKAEAAHSGAYSIFFPVFTIEGVKENRDEKRLPVFPNPDTTSISPIRNQALVGRVIQLFPTGAVLDFATDLRRDVNAPDRFQSPDRTKNRIFNLRFTQPLLRGAWPTVVRNAITVSAYDRQIQNTLLLDQKLKTVFLVKSAFYEVLLQHELLKVNQAAIERDSTLLFASESKVEAKLATRRDVLSAEIQLASDKVTLIKNQTDYEFALDGLKEILGLPIELEIDIADTELDFSIQTLDEQALIERAAMMNPTLQSTALAVKRSKLQQTVARNARLPQLDLVASYSRNFESKLASDPEENTDLHATAWEFSFNFSYPFLNRDAVTKAEIAQVDVSQQQERLQELRRQIQVSIRSIVRSTYSAIEEIKTLQRSIESAEQKVAFATTMFNLGRASNLDITDAQEALLKAETQYVQKLVDYHIQLALLESLTGQVITN